MYLGPKLAHDLCTLALELGRPGLAPTAYDTARAAWQSSSSSPLTPAFPPALDWLLHNQNGDGTWGAAVIHHHDRVVSTLAGIAALAKWREVAPASLALQDRIAAAAWGVATHFARLPLDLQPTTDFTPLMNQLVAEARWRGIAIPGAPPPPTDSGVLTAGQARRDTFTGEVTPEGSSAPALPVPTQETAWVLHALTLIEPSVARASGQLTPALARLADLLQQPALATNDPRLMADIDARALAFRVLSWAGHEPDVGALVAFIDSEAALAGPRMALAAAHLFEAISDAAPFAGKERCLRRALALLTDSRGTSGQWHDDRHASPYLPTAHAIIALPASLTLTGEGIRYLEDTQLPDGSWGHFDRGTVEETAYCLQALGRHRRAGGLVNTQQLEAGTRWLAARAGQGHQDHPALFVGTSLYCPTRMVEAAALSALAITEG